MIKFQGLSETFKELAEDARNALEFTLAAVEGDDRNEVLIQIIDDFLKKDEIVNCWLNATKMRSWLIQKKNYISEKLEYADDKEEKEKAMLKEIIQKIVTKAEFLSVLQSPKTKFKAEKVEIERDTDSPMERQASLVKQMSIVNESQQPEEHFDMKKRR